ncbi:hypothetical protein HanIR_Chr17g0867801 [Helianthus annuus]|nr:hypothetical protein HanIR_Chr17g0867801 [Helianthus annuus]
MPPVRSATLFEYFAAIFDVSVSMDDDTNTIEFLVKLLSVPTTISYIQSSISHVSMSVLIEFDCIRVSIRVSIDSIEYHTKHKVNMHK